ncbi:MAG: LLM class F420-dependent oxidoreductase [Acidimicrobiia bacterium]|jgi:F420-dependent oxidoreductase-like protein
MTRFGLQLPNFSLGVPDAELFERFADLAVAGEDSGFSSLWVMDHLYQLPALGGEDEPMLEAYTLLGALAARTSTAQLGTLVTGVTYRNPALLAKQVTTLDIISGGRAILGIGAAWHDIEHVAFGFDYPPDRERLDRLEEALQICRGMLTEDVISFDGTHYRVANVKNLPRPIRSGGIPIMVGGGGEKRTLRLVAQYADACNVSGDLETVRHKLEVLRGHCEAVGRDPSEVTTTRLSAMFLVDTPEQAAETREMIAGLADEEFAAACTIGDDDGVVEQVAALIDAGVQEPIFNMPFADAATIRRAGALLTSAFG